MAIAIGFGVLMPSDDTIQSTKIDENLAVTEEIRTPKNYSVQLEESVDMKTP